MEKRLRVINRAGVAMPILYQEGSKLSFSTVTRNPTAIPVIKARIRSGCRRVRAFSAIKSEARKAIRAQPRSRFVSGVWFNRSEKM